MTASLHTQRLRIVPLTLFQLQLCLNDLPALEAELELPIARDMLTERVHSAIHRKIKLMKNMEVSQHPWQTYWLLVVSAEQVGAGLAGFKGVPNEYGITEIGYGTDPAYQNQGYMSEAVRALVDWALGHPICKAVTAITVENPASRRLLEKLGAHLIAEDRSSSSWEFTR